MSVGAEMVKAVPEIDCVLSSAGAALASAKPTWISVSEFTAPAGKVRRNAEKLKLPPAGLKMKPVYWHCTPT